MKIAYQGTRGSYSESALIKQFGPKATPVAFETFEEVFEALRSKKVAAVVLPFENTLAGSVIRNYDLLYGEDFYIIGEVLLPIHHHLLGQKGARLSEIKRVYSHPQALEQCSEFLAKHKIQAVPEYDTAGAAELVKKRNKKDEAAIASEDCMRIYDLAIVKKGIEKNKFNITKFFVIVRKEDVPADLVREKTSVVFKTKHQPGALVYCLQRLAKLGVNITKLESRPQPGKPWNYVFYADLLGGTDDEIIQSALSEMEATSLSIKVLGSYPIATGEDRLEDKMKTFK